MAKYRLNLSFDIDITADEDSEVSEEEMVEMLQNLYHNDRKEFIDSLCIVILHDCPLTLLEKKYLGSSIAELREKKLANYDILYKEDHSYETQVELLINLTCLIVFKILILIFLDLFNIDKPNYPAIYISSLFKKYTSPFIDSNINFFKNSFFYAINTFIIVVIIFIIYCYFMKNTSKDNKLSIKDNNNSTSNHTSKSIN